MIDILVPVLGRPQNAQPLVDSIDANTTVDYSIWFVCSPGDQEQIDACHATKADVVMVAPWENGPSDYARKINAAFRSSTLPYVLNGADDIMFTPGWDTIALRMMKDGIGVVATNDKANRQVMRGEFGTHCLISRAYIEERGGTGDGTPGVVMHEGYDHNFVDRELCDVARSRGAFAYAARSVVRHRHPHWRTAVWDDTYRKGSANFAQDHRLFNRRSRMWATRKRDSISR